MADLSTLLKEDMAPYFDKVLDEILITCKAETKYVGDGQGEA